jgi:hypothetical protein
MLGQQTVGPQPSGSSKLEKASGAVAPEGCGRLPLLVMAHVFSAPRELRLDPYAAASTVSVDAEMRPLLLLAATVGAPPLMRSSFCSIEHAIDVGESPAPDRAASVSPQKPDRRKRPGAAEALRCAPRCASPHESGAERDPVGLPRKSPL